MAGWPTEEALAAAAAVGVPRIVQIGCDLPGARWAVGGRASVRRAGRRRRAAPQRGAAAGRDRRPGRGAGGDRAARRRRTTRSGRSARPGSTTSAPAPEGRAAQVESFRRHIDLAKRLDKTLVIHDRDAHDEVLEVIDERGRARALGDALLLRRRRLRRALPGPRCVPLLRRHGHVQERRSPCATRSSSRPLDRILVETDAPFLTPMPHRGRPNASYLVPHTMRAMAEVRGDDLEALCVAVTATTDAAFGGAW